MRTRFGAQRRKVGGLNYFWLQFRWSPDSTSIAFIGSVPAAQGGGPSLSEAPLCVTSIDDPAPRQLAMLRKSDDSGGAWDWMPDSQHIIYATHEQDVANLHKINIQSGDQHSFVTTEPFAAIYDVAVSSWHTVDVRFPERRLVLEDLRRSATTISRAPAAR